MVWYGMVWDGILWYGILWHGLGCYAIEGISGAPCLDEGLAVAHLKDIQGGCKTTPPHTIPMHEDIHEDKDMH